jgi:hypothetical protein
MATSYTTFLGLALPVTGELSGTWGDTVNNYISNYIDAAVAGAQTVTADTTLTKTTGSSLGATSSQYAIIIASPASANITITAPAASKIYTIINTSGTYTVKIVGAGPTTGVTLGVSEKAQVAWNGSDFVRIGASGGPGVFSSITNTGLTSGRVVYSTTGGLETDSANLLFNGTTLTANTLNLTNALGTTYGGTGLSSFTSGGVVYASSSSVLATGSALTFDGTNLGIGTSSPNAKIELLLTTTDATVNAEVMRIGTGGRSSGGGTAGRSALISFFDSANSTLTGAIGGYRYNSNVDYAGGLKFFYNGTSASSSVSTLTEGMRLDSSGNLLVNTTSAVSGSKLVVASGDATIYGLTVGRGAGAVSSNTAVGASALASVNTTGFSVGIGYQAGFNNTSGVLTAVGYQAGYSNTTANPIDAFGYRSLYANTTGANNVAVGTQALVANTTASNNTAVGYQAGYSNQTAIGAVFIGYQAGYGSVGISTTINYNTAVGNQAGYALTSGYGNTFLGNGSGNLVTTGYKNTILGTYSGNQGGLDIRTASNYIVLSDGDGNPRQIIDASGNLGLGVTPSAWFSNRKAIDIGGSVSTVTGANITIFGNNYYIDTGGTNRYVTTGAAAQQMLFPQAGGVQFYTAPSGTAGNAITFTQAMTLDASGVFLLGTTNVGATNSNSFIAYGSSGGFPGAFIANHLSGTSSGQGYGFFCYNGTVIGSITQSGTTAVLYNVTSDQRLKENIVDAPEFGSIIDSLQVRSFDWKSDGNHQRAGFVAQELVSVAPEAVHQPADPEEMMAVDYSKLVPMLVKEIQSLRIRIAQLEAK